MNEQRFSEAFQDLARKMGMAVEAAWIPLFYRHASMLLKWNRKINLTSVTDWKEVIVKHFLDSLAMLPLIPENARVLDLGSGAGFPGVPLRIARPNISMTLAESSTKKRVFLLTLLDELRFFNVDVILGPNPNLPRSIPDQRFDLVLTRAVGSLALLEDLGPMLLEKGGAILALKGPGFKEEFEKYEKARGEKGRLLKAEIAAEFDLPAGMGHRLIVRLPAN